MTDDLWLPGVERDIIKSRIGTPLIGKSHQLPITKLLWHTTEGSSIAGARAAYMKRRGITAGIHPHITADKKARRLVQHCPLNRYSYSLRDRSDRRGVIQVEVVGSAADTDIWPDEYYEWLGKYVAGPIVKLCPGINLLEWPEFYDELDGIVLASPNSPVRMSTAEFDGFVGQLGHQHAPAPDSHWDPGEWRPEVIAINALSPDPPSDTEGLPAMYDTQRDSEVGVSWGTWLANGTTHVRWFGTDRPAAKDKPGGAWIIHEQASIVKVNPSASPYA